MPSATPPSNRAEVMAQFAQQAWERGEFFFYVRIPEPLLPVARCTQYEEPLDDLLAGASVGRVTGGGSKLGAGGSIEYCGIDVVVSERVRGLEVLRSALRSLDAPAQTIIEEYLPTYREHSLQLTVA